MVVAVKKVEAHRHAWVQGPDQPVRVGGREVGEDDDKGEDELEAKVGHACLLELVVGPVDPVDEGCTRDGPTTLGAHVQGGSERYDVVGRFSLLLWKHKYMRTLVVRREGWTLSRGVLSEKIKIKPRNIV